MTIYQSIQNFKTWIIIWDNCYSLFDVKIMVEEEMDGEIVQNKRWVRFRKWLNMDEPRPQLYNWRPHRIYSGIDPSGYNVVEE